MTLHAFAAAMRPQVSSDVSCLLGAQQQTCCTLEMLAIDGTEEHSTISWTLLHIMWTITVITNIHQIMLSLITLRLLLHTETFGYFVQTNSKLNDSCIPKFSFNNVVLIFYDLTRSRRT